MVVSIFQRVPRRFDFHGVTLVPHECRHLGWIFEKFGDSFVPLFSEIHKKVLFIQLFPKVRGEYFQVLLEATFFLYSSGIKYPFAQILDQHSLQKEMDLVFIDHNAGNENSAK